ncbi:MAG TPA: hypothetical protein VM818_03780 [Vicinamibacterales bacterium]|nr:hypothetical protein [Vicinamibacterales bacterium]
MQPATASMTRDWIARLAEDERRRDDARLRVTEAVARKAHVVAVHGQRLLDELRASVVRDIEAFRSEFPGDPAREIVFEAAQPDGGFAVRKPEYPSAALSVAPQLPAASVRCEYRFTPTNGLPPREDRIEFLFTSDGDETLHIRHPGTGQVFTNADALSEYLLVPVFTGRPR